MRAGESELPLGVMTAVAFAALHRFLERTQAVEMIQEPGNADGAQGGQRTIEFFRPQPRNFFQRAALHHPVEARLDPRIQHRALGREKQAFAL